MERDITREYRQAHKEVQAKLDEYLSRFEREDKKLSMEVKAGRMTMKDYQDWRVRHIGMGQRWEELRDTLASDLHNANQLAMSIAKGYLPDVYALNHDYGTFYMEKQGKIDTSYTLIDHQAMERLIRENPKLLPDPTPNGPTAKMLARHKDLRWNRQKLQSAVIQGILQGEGIGSIADRFQRVTDMNRKAAIRNARTAMNGAANGGRMDSLRRADKMGVKTVKEWSAVGDERTRASHLDIDEERREIEEPFSNGLMFPGDMTGPADEVYNCRCDLLSWVKGFEPNDYVRLRDREVGTFDEWRKERKAYGRGIEKRRKITIHQSKNSSVAKDWKPIFNKNLNSGDEGYINNCGNCCVLKALSDKGITGYTALPSEGMTLERWSSIFVGNQPLEYNVITPFVSQVDFSKDLVSQYGNNASGSIFVGREHVYKDGEKSHEGHFFMWEIKDGKVSYNCPQYGYDNAGFYLELVERPTIITQRWDNAIFTGKIEEFGSL